MLQTHKGWPCDDEVRFRLGIFESRSRCLERYLETAGCREWVREEGVQPGLGPKFARRALSVPS